MGDIITTDAKPIMNEGIMLVYDGNRTGYALDTTEVSINEYSEDLCRDFYERYFSHAEIAFGEFNAPIVNPAITSTANHEQRSELIQTLVDIFPETIETKLSELKDKGIRLKVVGDKEKFTANAKDPEYIKSAIDYFEDETKKGSKLLVLSCAYNHDLEFKKMVEQNPDKSFDEMLRVHYGFEDEELLPGNLFGLFIRTWRPRTSNLQAVGSGNFDISLLPAPAKFMTDDKFRLALTDYIQRNTAKGGGTVYGDEYRNAVAKFEEVFSEIEVVPQGIVVPDGNQRVWIPLPKRLE